MKLTLDQIPAKQWHQFAPDAHRAVFGELLPAEYDRIDYALLAVDGDKARPVAYMTLREFDADTVYLKHGGAFPPLRGNFQSFYVYNSMLDWVRSRYKRATTLVENTNVVYIKMALTAGFRIIGIRNFQGIVLLELYMEGG